MAQERGPCGGHARAALSCVCLTSNTRVFPKMPWLASLGHDPREDGGHGQGVSCTDKKQIVKTNLPCRTLTGWALRLTIVSEMGSEV